VHLPLALALLVPVFALLTIVSIRFRFFEPQIWVGVLLLQCILVASAYVALETGEEQEKRVEAVVSEQFIEEHEKAAERFMRIAAATLVVAGLGLLGGRAGEIARIATVGVSLAALAAAFWTGRLGGELVYTHGAAAAYTQPAPEPEAGGEARHGFRDPHDEEDD
jgi:hypothetical protein